MTPFFKLCALSVSCALIAFTSLADAATWSIQEITRRPGEVAQLTVSLAGDGQTSEGQITLVFDESRLSLPVTSGSIPGAASNNGFCARTSSNSVTILTGSIAGTPLSTRPTVLCTLPFTVFANAQRGYAKLGSTLRFCGNPQGAAQNCTLTGGGVQVDAPLPPPQPAIPPSREIVVGLAANGPRVDALIGGFSAGQPSPIQALNTTPPIAIRRLVEERRGDALTYILNNPETPEAKLARFVVLTYADAERAQASVSALRSDSMISSANIPRRGRFSASAGVDAPKQWLGPVGKPVQQPEAEVPAQSRSTQAKSSSTDFNQYHRNVLNIPEAWTYAGGWGLIAIADTGIAENHPGLRAFEPTLAGSLLYTKGNYLPTLSGNQVAPQFGPDERSPEPTAIAACDGLDGTIDGLMRASNVGHGTHVAGLAAANAFDSDAVEGTCINCGISARKIMTLTCVPDPLRIDVSIDFVALIPARNDTNRFGAQVFSSSFGLGLPFTFNELCASAQFADDCLPILAQVSRDVLLPSAAGNSRMEINFPAEDQRIPAIGGTDELNNFWSDFPNCLSTLECGSNFRQNPNDPDPLTDRTEVVAPARTITSTMYPGFDWAANLMCGDSIGSGPSNDGIGRCTGTSMSTPMLAGIYGLLRSINPLVPAGSIDAGPQSPGIRTLVANTSSLSGGLRQNQLGFGLPNVALAAKGILGTVRGLTAKNRAIPLFGLYSPAMSDYAVTANPQLATALQIDLTHSYRTLAVAGMIEGTPVPAYAAFPGVAIPEPPRARAYILSTEFTPVSGRPVTPMYLLRRQRPWPLGCDSGVNCNLNNQDFMLVSQENDLNFAVNAGYQFLGLQGYIYQRCSNEPACLPTGTQNLYLKCNIAQDDCAVFLENQRPAFEAAGYTASFKGGSEILGYAYGTQNSDADLLPDAVEYVAGTHPTSSDSDGDSLLDHEEYPLTALPVSDPCTPGNTFCGSGDNLFRNGFE